jgi:tetratricopeptide (TPR) repeat protein
MPAMPQRFAIPKNEDVFEEICLKLLQLYWSRPGLELFGKRGERQFGIDILDIGGQTPIYAAQCKLREEHKSLSPAEIQAEVDAAKQFRPPLGKYAILTTAKVSTQAQKKVRDINQVHRAAGLFEVELMTWERLCSLLQQYTEVQEQYYGEIALGRATRIESQLIAIRVGVQALTSRADGDAIDSEINEARECLTKREFQLATFLLNRTQRVHGEELNARQRFRVLSNLGAAALGLGRSESAAKLFVEASEHQPDDEQGKINRVLADFIVGDAASCHAKATLLRRDYPRSTRLAALWVNSTSRELSFATTESDLDPVLRSDPEVSVALARKALTEFRFGDALKYAMSAASSSPKWPQPQLVRAQTGLGRALRAQMGFDAKSASQQTALLEAEEASSKAIALAQQERDPETERAALVIRVETRLLLKKTDEAVEDAETAERLDSQDASAALAMAQALFALGRIDDAIAKFKRAYGLSGRPDTAFVYGTALQNRGRDGDLDEAIAVLTQIPLRDIPTELRPTTVTHVIQCFAKKKDWQAAESYIDKAADALPITVTNIARGYLAHYQEKRAEAEQFALEARAALLPDENAETKESLARLLMLLGRPGDALPVLQDLFDREVPFFDPKNLLTCAAKLSRDDVVMQTCERLVSRGVEDWSFIEFEIQYLEKYNIDLAVTRLQSFLGKHPGNKLAKMRLSLIGLRLNRSDIVQTKPEDVPPIEDLPLSYAIPAVQVMKYSGHPNAAVDYAYRFLRVHFNDIEAHQALIASLVPGAFSPDIPSILNVVVPGSAVCYQEIPAGFPTWAVLEDTDSPSADFEEISLLSPLAAELLGKKVGDVVIVAKGVMQDRTAKVLEILPKYVRRYQDAMGEMQVRFGAASSVESIRIDKPEEGDRDKGLQVILASAERRAAEVANARASYDQLPTPLHLYGAHFGKDAYQALLSLAAEQPQKIKCCLGTSEERNEALQALQTAKSVVVDITALATLRLLGLERALLTAKFDFVVSERTLVVLQEMVSEARLFNAPGGTIFYKGGKHILYEETASDKEQRFKQDEEFVGLLQKTTERRSAPELAALEPERRTALEKVFGGYGAESMLLSSDPDCVLWTDDLIQAQAAAQEFGSRRVWTQLLLGVLTDAGVLTVADYNDASARLIGMEFTATLFDSASMLAGLRLASWDAEKKPASQFLAIYSDPATDSGALFRIYVEFTIRLYREPLPAELKCSVTQAFLETLARRPEAMTLLKGLRRQSASVFGLNAVGKDQFDQCFDRWMNGRGKPLVFVP